MTTFKIDLKTKIISSDTNVYLARAGKQGHLFAQVLAEKAIGPDLPIFGIDLSKGFDEEKNLIAKINRARRLSRWIQSLIAKRGDLPSKNLEIGAATCGTQTFSLKEMTGNLDELKRKERCLRIGFRRRFGSG